MWLGFQEDIHRHPGRGKERFKEKGNYVSRTTTGRRGQYGTVKLSRGRGALQSQKWEYRHMSESASPAQGRLLEHT